MAEDNAYLSLIFNEPIYFINETLSINFNTPVEEVPYSYFGENKQGVLLLVENEVLTEEMLTFITNIIKAVNLTLADVAIVENYVPDANKPLPKFEKLIQFGTKIHLLGLESTALYTPTLSNKKSAVLVETVSSIIGDVQKKRLLWEAIKKMF